MTTRASFASIYQEKYLVLVQVQVWRVWQVLMSVVSLASLANLVMVG
jgi:hypothetical protein